MRVVLLGAVAAAALLLWWQAGQGGADDGDTAYEAPDLFDQADALFQEFTDMNSNVSPEQQGRNLNAFMRAIRVGEGTTGPDGYRTIVDGSLSSSSSQAPAALPAPLAHCSQSLLAGFGTG